MAWSPLGGGTLMTGQNTELSQMLNDIAQFGTIPAAVAIAWLLAHPSEICL